jgi:hypothetical protein
MSSAFSIQQFYNKMQQDHVNNIQSIVLPSHGKSSNSSSPNPDVSILESFSRPQEILSCVWRNMAEKKYPNECACSNDNNVSNRQACQDGYKTVKTRVDQHTLEKDPNSVIVWCNSNVPTNYQQNKELHDSWIIGCLDGIRGPHKI